MKKRLLSLLLVLMLALSLTLTACGGDNKTNDDGNNNTENQGGETTDQSDWVDLSLSFSSNLPDDNVGVHNMVLLQEKLDQAMPGKVTITLFGSNTLVASDAMLDGVLNGATETGYLTTASFTARLPECTLFDTPGISWASAESATRAFRDFTEEKQPAELEGMKVLLWQCTGPGALVSTMPIHSIDDVKGIQIRAMGSTADTVASWGATPVTIEWTDCYEAMRSGLVDVIYTNIGAAGAGGFGDVSSYNTVMPLYNCSYLFVMNQDIWDSMPASQQEAFQACCDEVFEEYTTKYQGKFDDDENSQKYLAALKEIYLLSDEEQAGFEEASAHLIDDYAATLDAQGIDGTGDVEYLRAKAEEYNALYDETALKENLEKWSDHVVQG